MLNNKLNLRKVVAIAICLAGVTMFSACSKEDKENAELQGIWKVDDTWAVEIKGNQAYFVLLDAEAIRAGLSDFLAVGDIAIKNLKKQNANTWTGNEVFWYYNTTTGRVISISYEDVDTYILSGDKNRLERTSDEYEPITYYRVQKATDPVPSSPSNIAPQPTQQNENIGIIKKAKR